MNRRFFYLAALLVCCLFGYSQQTKKVTINGVIKGFKYIIEVEDKGDTEPLQISNSDRSFVPDSQGKFSIEFALSSPNYFRIARNILYLSPGDNLEVNIDYYNAENSIFKGSHSQENNYLKHIPYPKAGSFLEGGTNIKSTVELTIQNLFELAQERKQVLRTYKNLSAEFRFLEQNRINVDLLNSVYMVQTYFPYVHKLTKDSQTVFLKNFQRKIDSIGKYLDIPINSRLLKLEVYRTMVPLVLKLVDKPGKDTLQINDWILAKNVFHEIQTDKKLDSASAIKKRINQVRTPRYRTMLKATFQKLVSYNGNKAIDIKLYDENAKAIALSSFRGKVIYLDLWATWCLPCLKEQQYVDSLKNNFSVDSAQVVFLSTSIDSDRNSWLNYIHKHSSSMNQYIVDLAALKSYFVSEIPRTIIIDKNFKIYALKGPMPSNPETINIIKKMLQTE